MQFADNTIHFKLSTRPTTLANHRRRQFTQPQKKYESLLNTCSLSSVIVNESQAKLSKKTAVVIKNQAADTFNDKHGIIQSY